MNDNPDIYLSVRKIATGYSVVITRPAAPLVTVSFDTTHDVAAAALLCDAVVISDDINVRHACRAIRVAVRWPEEVTG